MQHIAYVGYNVLRTRKEGMNTSKVKLLNYVSWQVVKAKVT